MRVVLVLLLLVLAACEPEATPLPVDPPTATSPPITPTPQAIRYGLAYPDWLAEIAPADQSARITPIDGPADSSLLGTQFDIIVGPGQWPESTPTPIEITVALVINTQLAPLDDPALPPIIRALAHPAAITAALDLPGVMAATAAPPADDVMLRTQLANAGWPDGFDLIATLPELPGHEQIITQFERAGLHVQLRPVFAWDRTHLTLIRWTGNTIPDAWAAGEIAPLYHIPVSFQASPGFEITFDTSGWPLARWSAAP